MRLLSSITSLLLLSWGCGDDSGGGTSGVNQQMEVAEATEEDITAVCEAVISRLSADGSGTVSRNV